MQDRNLLLYKALKRKENKYINFLKKNQKYILFCTFYVPTKVAQLAGPSLAV